MTAHPRFPMSGAQLVGALMAIMVATAVLPPGAAWFLNMTRVTQTHTRVASAAAYLRAHAHDFAGTNLAIACGPGRLPVLVPATASARAAARSLPSHGDWLQGAISAPDLFGAGMPTDAWGRCFLFSVGAWAAEGPVWLLSAGPNGLVETPLSALVVAGDDIGQRLR